MRIITWNINSVRLREPSLLRLAKKHEPDIICLQETKCPNEAFPEKKLRGLGYTHILKNGIKGYHGVAIISRVPIVGSHQIDYCRRKDGRHLCATIKSGRRTIDIHNFYVPAGGDEADVKTNEKFAHKMSFVREMCRRLQGDDPQYALLMGDLNIAPYEHDVWSSQQLQKVVSHTPQERKALNKLLQTCDWQDVARHFVSADEKLYSWWSYRSTDWKKSDRGRRLDHLWVTKSLLKAVQGFEILKAVRGWQRPSDHVPVIMDIDI
ncbi:MAG: exodeoxyribonuclease III [Alphaproteobacteria bacterium]|nr:exodeoxyribonuclease III [Alphaproteobacteria bacterium]